MKRNDYMSNSRNIAIALGVTILIVTIYWAWTAPADAWITNPVGFFPRLKMVAEILTPIAILVGLAFAWKRTQIADKQAETARMQAATAAKQAETAAEQVRLVERGQVTERFTTSVEQLGSKERTIRLGAIYSLERIAKDSEDDRGTIAEVLCSFVRDWKTREEDPERGSEQIQPKPEVAESEEEPADGKNQYKPLPEDVLAALTVLGDADERGNELHKGDRDLRRIDFSLRDLSGRILRGLDLSHSNFEDAKLSYADLTDANLTSANFSAAHLKDAILAGTNLQGAKLIDTDLQVANLENADLEYADLEGAELFAACLRGAKLEYTNLKGASFFGADLEGASLTQAQLNLAEGSSSTRLPDHLERPKHWK